MKTKRKAPEKMPNLNTEVLKFQLQSIRLFESNTKIGNLQDNKLPEQINTTLGLRVDHLQHEETKDEGAIAYLSHGLKACYKGHGEKDPAFEVFATFQLTYMLEKQCKFLDLEHVFKPLVVANAWPYWREFVQSMTSRMGFPALTMPIQNVVDTANQLEKLMPIESKPQTKSRKTST